MKNLKANLLLVGMVVLLVLQSCNKDVSVLVFDNPVEQGSSKLIVTVTRLDGVSVSDFTLEITGAITLNQAVTGNTYTLENAAPGTYNVKVSKNNFIGANTAVVITQPATGEKKVYSTSLNITEKRAPVTINNATGGTITVPPTNTGGTGIGSNPATIVIPPGAISGGGTTQITITPVPTVIVGNQPTTPTAGLAGFSFICEPAGLVFQEPITVSFPLGIPATVSANVPMRMLYRNAAGVFSTNPADIIPVTVTGNGQTGSVQITHFSEWVLSINATLEVGAPQPQVFNYGASACGAAFNQTFTRTATPGAVVTAMGGTGANPITITAQISYPAAPSNSYRPSVNFFQRTYTLRNPLNNSVIETYTLPTGPITSSPNGTFCHNSGGG
jgi:hypothetical protein